MKNEMKKFELLSENKINWRGYTLYRIKATTNFITNSGIEVNAGQLGGWVEKEENLSQEGKAWVFKNAKIYGTAKVYGNAEIWGEAEICDNARVCGNAEVWDFAKIGGNAEIWNDAKVYDNARVCSDARVYGNAEICGVAKIGGDAKVAGNAIVWGNATVWGDAEIGGNAIISGDATICGDAKISSPNNLLNITPVGNYKASLTLFKTKNNSIEISYNWKLYTLEEFDPVMSDWTKEEQKIVKAAIEILGGCF